MLKRRPEDVFTPRRPEVNERMYVARPNLEAALEEALGGTRHILVHGESGTGKTWLYRHTLARLHVQTVSVNLANAVRLPGGLDAEFANLIDRLGTAKKIGYQEAKDAEVSIGFAKGSLAHSGEFTLGQKEPFEACLEYLHAHAGSSPSVLVVENLDDRIPPTASSLAPTWRERRGDCSRCTTW